MSDRDGVTGSAGHGKENPALSIMLYTAIVVGAMLTALLAGGIAMAGATSDRVGSYVGYSLGLTMITIAAVMGVGAGALLSQRVLVKENAEIHAEIREVRESLVAMRAEVRNELEAVLTIERYNSETLADQLAARRNGHLG